MRRRPESGIQPDQDNLATAGDRRRSGMLDEGTEALDHPPAKSNCGLGLAGRRGNARAGNRGGVPGQSAPPVGNRLERAAAHRAIATWTSPRRSWA